MIPHFLRPERVPYASVEVVPARPLSEWWVRLKFKQSGYEDTYVQKSALNRGLLIITTAPYADVVSQGER
jgi:hypothetical protein